MTIPSISLIPYVRFCFPSSHYSVSIIVVQLALLHFPTFLLISVSITISKPLLLLLIILTFSHNTNERNLFILKLDLCLGWWGNYSQCCWRADNRASFNISICQRSGWLTPLSYLGMSVHLNNSHKGTCCIDPGGQGQIKLMALSAH